MGVNYMTVQFRDSITSLNHQIIHTKIEDEDVDMEDIDTVSIYTEDVDMEDVDTEDVDMVDVKDGRNLTLLANSLNERTEKLIEEMKVYRTLSDTGKSIEEIRKTKLIFCAKFKNFIIHLEKNITQLENDTYANFTSTVLELANYSSFFKSFTSQRKKYKTLIYLSDLKRVWNVTKTLEAKYRAKESSNKIDYLKNTIEKIEFNMRGFLNAQNAIEELNNLGANKEASYFYRQNKININHYVKNNNLNKHEIKLTNKLFSKLKKKDAEELLFNLLLTIKYIDKQMGWPKPENSSTSSTHIYTYVPNNHGNNPKDFSLKLSIDKFSVAFFRAVNGDINDSWMTKPGEPICSRALQFDLKNGEFFNESLSKIYKMVNFDLTNMQLNKYKCCSIKYFAKKHMFVQSSKKYYKKYSIKDHYHISTTEDPTKTFIFFDEYKTNRVFSLYFHPEELYRPFTGKGSVDQYSPIIGKGLNISKAHFRHQISAGRYATHLEYTFDVIIEGKHVVKTNDFDSKLTDTEQKFKASQLWKNMEKHASKNNRTLLPLSTLEWLFSGLQRHVALIMKPKSVETDECLTKQRKLSQSIDNFFPAGLLNSQEAKNLKKQKLLEKKLKIKRIREKKILERYRKFRLPPPKSAWL